jgi:uncharacterized protein involved in exopolysaccharide biosynthesis/Mrp family chromosome partitioning ATPase
MVQMRRQVVDIHPAVSVDDTIKQISIEQILLAARRHSLPSAVIFVLCFGLAAFYLLASPPLYSGTVSIYIESLRPTRNIEDAISNLSVMYDPSAIESQMELLHSNKIALDVVENLKLTENPEFTKTDITLISSIKKAISVNLKHIFGVSSGSDNSNLSRKIAEELLDFVAVTRTGKAYILEFSYLHSHPDWAASIANGFADAYLADQLESRAAAGQAVNAWYKQRISELRQHAVDADAAVEEFRSRNGLVSSVRSGSIQDTSGLLTKLRELQRQSDAARDVYQSFLTRYQESGQQKTFPMSEARIISRAYPPEKPARPRKALTFGFALFSAAAISALFAALREMRDRSFRTPQQVRETLGIPCVIVPLEQEQRVSPKVRSPQNESLGQFSVTGLAHVALKCPLGPLSASLHRAQIALGPNKLIGVTSTELGEGKSTISACLAAILGAAGHSVLIIDCDLRSREITKALGFHVNPESCLLHKIWNGSPIKADLLRDVRTKVDLLPCEPVQHVSDVSSLASPAAKTFFDNARKNYDYVICDLPEIDKPETQIIAQNIDTLWLVIAWGETSSNLVLQALREWEKPHNKISLTLLNKVNLPRLANYQAAHRTPR